LARKRMRNGRDYLRALARRVEVDAQELRIMGSKCELLRTLVAASGAKTVGFGVPGSIPKWRATADEDGNYCFAMGAMMARPPMRSGRITSDGLRSCATPHGRLSSRFREWFGYPSAGAISINPRNGAMGQKRRGACRRDSSIRLCTGG